jgi:HD-GYP domain-containing protein (c-di-GMP phosphodiesterase class II)
LEPAEVAALQVRRGSLTDMERVEIESHVQHTIKFLKEIPWGRRYADVPRIAGAHHEYMNGTGYPRRMPGEDIPVESRIMTIADIFDALTASDRPYKKAVPIERALSIIDSEVRAGKCDAELFRVFVEGEVYKRVI